MAQPYLWRRKSNGTYYAVWMENGVQRKKSLKTKDRRTANRAFNGFKRELLAGKVTPIFEGTNKKLFPFVDEFLENIAGQKAPGTVRNYTIALSKAKSCWGDIPLGHITERHVDGLVSDMLRVGLKATTINKELRFLKAALRKAKRWKYLQHYVDFPPRLKEEKATRFLTKEQLGRLIKQITDNDDQEFADFCLLSAYTGLRSGELLRLTPEDIDNPEGFIRVTAERKNRSEYRAPINDNAKAIIDRMIASNKRPSGKLYRTYTYTSSISRRFKMYARQCGLGDFKFHDLRHTYGSHLAMSGETPLTIQSAMGHDSISSTMVYTHLSPEYIHEAVNKLNYGPMPMASKQAKKTKK